MKTKRWNLKTSEVLCTSMIKEEWIKEKSCIVASLAWRKKAVGYDTAEEKLWVMLQSKRSCKLCCSRREVASYTAAEKKLQVMLQMNENLIV